MNTCSGNYKRAHREPTCSHYTSNAFGGKFKPTHLVQPNPFWFDQTLDKEHYIPLLIMNRHVPITVPMLWTEILGQCVWFNQITFGWTKNKPLPNTSNNSKTTIINDHSELSWTGWLWNRSYGKRLSTNQL